MADVGAGKIDWKRIFAAPTSDNKMADVGAAKIRFQSILPAPTSAILLSGGPIESFTWTIGNRPGQRAKYARGSCPPLVIQYRSISSWTSLGSVSASRMSYGSLPSTGVNSK